MRIALCICPQWSVQTPSFAIGSLKSHIKNKDVELISQNAIATVKKNNSLEKIVDLEFSLYIND